MKCRAKFVGRASAEVRVEPSLVYHLNVTLAVAFIYRDLIYMVRMRLEQGLYKKVVASIV